MSALGSGTGVLQPILIRSVTPGANEKVMKYLESMEKPETRPSNSPPHSILGAGADDNYETQSQLKSVMSPGSKKGASVMKLPSPPPPGQLFSPSMRSKLTAATGNGRYGDLAKPPSETPNEQTPPDHENDDADSNVQVGERSDLGDIPQHEPGPNDPPGPKYESYDSGPSFGNFGPLPTEDRASVNPYGNGGWVPDWTKNKLPSEGPWPQDNGGARTPSQANPALPAENHPASPRTPSKAPSQVKSISQVIGGMDQDRPFSPSARSKLTATGKPYLYPEGSAVYGEDPWDPPESPKSRAYSKAPSISPSDSPSQWPKPPKQAPKAFSSNGGQSRSPPPGSHSPLPVTGGGTNNHHTRPFSPYRTAPTHEDLIHAAVRGRALVIPDPSPEELGEEGRVLDKSPGSPAVKLQPTGGSVVKSQSGGSVLKSPPPGSTTQLARSPLRVETTLVVSQQQQPQQEPQPEQMPSPASKVASRVNGTASQVSVAKQSVPPMSPRRPFSPSGLDSEAARIVNEAVSGARHSGSGGHHHGHGHAHGGSISNGVGAATPRTSVYDAALEPGLTGHFHDDELCELLRHESDTTQPEVVRRALRKAIRQRVKKLGIKYDTQAIKEYKRSYRDHDHDMGLGNEYDDEPPRWASDIKRELVLMQQRIESLGPKIENLRRDDESYDQQTYDQHQEGSRFQYNPNEDYTETRTPQTRTVNIETQPTGTMADSMYRQPEETVLDEEGNVIVRDTEFDDMTETAHHHRGMPPPTTDNTYMRTPQRTMYQSELGRDDSPGQQRLEEELYKLQQRPRRGSQSGHSHRTWEITRENEYDDEDGQRGLPSGVPTIPDTNGDGEGYHGEDGDEFREEGAGSPPLPALPDHDEDEDDTRHDHSRQMEVHGQGPWNRYDNSTDGHKMALQPGAGMRPWERVHAQLFQWAMVWPVSELENALNSTTRGYQVDEVALTIWSMQTYKRYMRARLTDPPMHATNGNASTSGGSQGSAVDRLFVPPNIADIVNNAVFNGRHGEACEYLRNLWTPFGLEGAPRLIVVLAKHRTDPNHWVVHRFSLPEGALTTYDSYPERTLPDGRPLGWWFAIRIAWPNTSYPKPDNLVQKMVRLHRPLQLPIDNSVAAAGIWRNILMGSRAERSLDLERMRDLINTEVKNLKQRKLLGKLTVTGGRHVWADA